MTVQQHLENLLKNSAQYILTDDDKKTINVKVLDKFVYAKLTSKKFRKWKMSDALIQRIQQTLKLTIEQNKPLEAIFFQGGYKLWRFPSSPEVDWAEFFNISYLLQYLAPIAAAYKQDVRLTYYVHTMIMELHDNLTTEEIDNYLNSFKKLVDEFSKYLPKNMKVRVWTDRDIYSRDEYFKIIKTAYKKAEQDYLKLPQDKKDYYRKLAELNIKWNGNERWDKLPENGKKEKIYQAAIYENSIPYLDKAIKTVKADKYILLFTKGSDSFIAVGTTKTSIAKHWVGFGVLERSQEKLYERVLTPSQFETIKNKKHKNEKVNLVNLKNFKEIWIFDERFDLVHK